MVLNEFVEGWLHYWIPTIEEGMVFRNRRFRRLPGQFRVLRLCYLQITFAAAAPEEWQSR